MMRSRLFLLATVLITLATPSVARADGYLGSGIGVAVGNPSAQGRADFIVDVGWLAREPIGLEIDAMLAPSFFGNQGPYGNNGVTTVMANVVLAAGESRGFGRYRRRAGVTPYLSGGLGVIRETTTAPAISNNDLGANLGAGVMAVSRRQVGVRGDVRYFRDLVGNSNGNTTSIDFGSFHFWRVSIGVLLRF